MSNSSSVPDKLPVNSSHNYEVIQENPTNSALSVVFKYNISDHETIPAWILASDNVSYAVVDGTGGGSGADKTEEGKRYVQINSSHQLQQLAVWGKWGDGDGDSDLLNRTAIRALMAAGQFQQEIFEGTYTISDFYTYKAYAFNATFSSSHICELPHTGCPQNIIRVFAKASGGNTVTVRAQVGDALDGTSQGSIVLPATSTGEYYEFHQVRDGSSLAVGWESKLPISGDLSDSAPIASIRRMTQNAYDALASTDPNTLYVIE